MMTKDKIHTFMNAVIKVREILTDEQALKIKDIYPEWKPEVQYVTGERVLYNNVLYKVFINHKSQSNWEDDTYYWEIVE